MNRCHTSDDTMRSFIALHKRNIVTAGHMIIGYPGSIEETVASDAEFVRKSRTKGIKLQNFHVVRNTAMAERYAAGEFSLMTMEEYVDMVILFLENTTPDVVILRLTGEAPAKLTVAPEWSLHKMHIISTIRKELAERNTWQGKALGYPREDLLTKPSSIGRVL